MRPRRGATKAQLERPAGSSDEDGPQEDSRGASYASATEAGLLVARANGFEEDPRAFSALGSAVRIHILTSVAAREKSISQLSQELGLNRITLRYHLGFLREQGFIEEIAPSGPRRVGRPATLYRMSKQAHVPGFPQRQFELLGQLALEALREAVGDDAASSHLQAKGRGIGKSMIDGVKARAQLEEWTPESFERLVLGGLFRDLGVASEVLSKSPNVLEYRVFSCPFLELAVRLPDLVCNALDRGFHDGIDEGLGGVRTERLACMGHGTAYCQYRVAWSRKSKMRASSDRERRGRSRTAVKGHV